LCAEIFPDEAVPERARLVRRMHSMTDAAQLTAEVQEMLETTAWPPPLDYVLLAARAEPAWKARADTATAAIVQNRGESSGH